MYIACWWAEKILKIAYLLNIWEWEAGHYEADFSIYGEKLLDFLPLAILKSHK